MSDPIEQPDPDLDDLSWDELEEVDPKAFTVARLLHLWAEERCCSKHHCVGTFLDLLAAEGYRVEPIQAPSFEDIRPEVDRGC